jgi:hypothetical protein
MSALRLKMEAPHQPLLKPRGGATHVEVSSDGGDKTAHRRLPGERLGAESSEDADEK